MRSLREVAALTAVIAAAPWTPPAYAQGTAATPPGSLQQVPAPPTFTAGWQEGPRGEGGFVLQSGNGDYRIALGVVAQTDGRFSLDDPNPIINTFLIRKIRPTFSGRLAKYFDFKVMPDFGSGTTIIQDAYFDVRFSQAFRVRTGKDKTPIGYELLIGDAYLLFPERALASSLVPNRDIGLQVQGDLAANKVFYAGGLFNGIPDGTSTSTELDTNNGKDFAGRVVVQPFRSGAGAERPLNGLGVQVGGSTGNQTGPLPSFKTSVGQTYFAYGSNATASGRRQRVSPAIFYYYKSLAAFAEYMQSTQRVAHATTLADVTNQAWEFTGSFLVTGERATDQRVLPGKPFDRATGSWGALQVLARYSVLSVDRTAFTAGLAAANASREARSFTLGANWYPTAYIKYYLTFERTVFDGNGDGARPPEHVILFRAQLAF